MKQQRKFKAVTFKIIKCVCYVEEDEFLLARDKFENCDFDEVEEGDVTYDVDFDTLEEVTDFSKE